MEISFFIRSKKNSNYSIENVFQTLQSELRRIHKIKSFTIPDGSNYFQSIIWAYKNSGSINHITGDVNYLSFGLCSKKTVLTVHDIGHYTDTLKFFKKYIYYLFWLKIPLERVKKITTVSEFTKSQIVKHIGIPENKIYVIHNPLPIRFIYKPRPINKKFTILQIGSGRNKNINNLLKAVIGLDVRLLLVNKLLSLETNDLLQEFKIDFLQFISPDNEQVVDLYSQSDILFFASTSEGFGMPIIESQAIGRPVITSNITSMPEVAGNAALFVNPQSTEEIRAAIISLMNNSDLYSNLVQEGLKNVKRFSLDNILNQYISLYEEI